MSVALDPQAQELADFLARYRDRSLSPILWIGAGASASVGYPTLTQLEDLVRTELRPEVAEGKKEFELIGAYVEEFSRADLGLLLQDKLTEPKEPGDLHHAVARLAGAKICRHLLTTNYDRLLEGALDREGVKFNPQVFEQNAAFQFVEVVQLLKIHGDLGSWKDVILTAADYDEFEARRPQLCQQLNLALRHRPVVFLGCSMQDPRLLDWLRSLSETERQGLFASRAVLTKSAWDRLSDAQRQLLASANVKPILVADHPAIPRILTQVADELAPRPKPESPCLVLEIVPDAGGWTVLDAEDPEHPHRSEDPLQDAEFIALLERLRERISSAIPTSAAQAAEAIGLLEGLAQLVGERLTTVLLSDEIRQRLLVAMNQKHLGRTQLRLQVRSQGTETDRILALPWELIRPHGDRFAVREGLLDFVREIPVEGAPELPATPREKLSVAVTIAAPDGQSALEYEREEFRLYSALAGLGQEIGFADLGEVSDFIELAKEMTPQVLHFSGHGLPGALVFEDELGFHKQVEIADLLRELNHELSEPGTFPHLFFLASCHGATSTTTWGAEAGKAEAEMAAPVTRDSRDLAAALGKGPSTAATLHREGFTQVVGYFGPVGDALCTRAEEAFYRVLAQGKSTLQAVSAARKSLDEPLQRGAEQVVYPLGWAQLALYHRGPDRPLAKEGEEVALDAPRRFRRKVGKVQGMPVLEWGFIGRRSLQHRVRRKLKEDLDAPLVLYGLGGLGKTALATHMLSRVLADKAEDRLILSCRELEGEADPISRLCAQVDEHGRLYQLPDWSQIAERLQETHPDPLANFEAMVRVLRTLRPHLVLYADNVETLQEAPSKEDRGKQDALGPWRINTLPWWGVLQQLAADGLPVLLSTRYRWPELEDDACLALDGMSDTDVLRLMETFDHLRKLPAGIRAKLAERADGHPRTVEFLDTLVKEQAAKFRGRMGEEEVWAAFEKWVLPEQTERIRQDLLLARLWELLTEPAQKLACRSTVLQRPAPQYVLERLLGSEPGEVELAAVEELVGVGLLTLHREPRLVGEKGQERLAWESRWLMHSLVRDFVAEHLDAPERYEAHVAAGQAYETWFAQRGSYSDADAYETIALFHAVDAGNLAWPRVQMFVLALRERARYRDAAELLARCEAAGTDGDALSRALLLQAQMEQRLGRSGEQVAGLLGRAAELAVGDEARGVVLHEQGSLLQEQGKYGEAEALLRQSLQIKEQTLGVEHPSYGVSLHALAGVLESQGKYGEAEALLRQSLKILEQTLGVEHRSYGASLHSLAGVLESQGKYGEAEALLRQSLKIKEQTLGVEHPEVCSTLTNLAGTLASLGRGDEAEPLLQRALRIAERSYGTGHPVYVQVLNIMAQLQASLGHPEAAETARKALTQLVAVFGNEHPMVQNVTPILNAIIAGNVQPPDRSSQLIAQARTAARAGHVDTAITAQQDAVTLLRAAGNDRDTLVSLSIAIYNLAGYYAQADRHDEAVQAFEEVVALDEQTGHEDLEADRQALENARRVAAMTPEERAAMQAAEAMTQLFGQFTQQTLEALQSGIDPEQMAQQLDTVAEQLASSEVAEMASSLGFPTFVQAIQALLRGNPLPSDLPDHFSPALDAIRQALPSPE